MESFSSIKKEKLEERTTKAAKMKKFQMGFCQILSKFFQKNRSSPLKKISKEKSASSDIEKKSEEIKIAKVSSMNVLKSAERMEKKLEEEKNKTLCIIQNLSDGIIVFDKEGKLSLVNSWAENFLNIKAEDLIGRSILELATFSNFQPLAEVLKKEFGTVFKKEISLRENLILEVSSFPIFSGKEKIGGFVILRNVTREKMIEKIKTDFIFLSAHQLRTPLSTIKWALRMFLDGDLGPLTSEQKEVLEKIYRSNERMISLINDLLNLTKIEEGRYILKPILADLQSIVESSLSSYKEEIEKKKIKIEFEKQENLPSVLVDTERIKLAIDNLLENAVKYTLTGGKIIISLKKKEKEVEFSIKDTGIGIPQAEQPRVFTKFFRGSNALKIETEGSGLGLFITKNIIEAHGGKIWFESKENEGSTFYFTLPVKGGMVR